MEGDQVAVLVQQNLPNLGPPLLAFYTDTPTKEFIIIVRCISQIKSEKCRPGIVKERLQTNSVY
jgi:hypothetical protein